MGGRAAYDPAAAGRVSPRRPHRRTDVATYRSIERQFGETTLLRLLLIEDDPDRIVCFTAWCPPDARLVVARGGGRALGLLERDPGRVYAGLLLDHDLPGQAVNDAERHVTGTQVVQGILRHVDPEIPVLIHSMNRGGARRMATTLTAAGFEVSAIPMAELSREHFLGWLDTVREVQRLLEPE